MPNDIPDWTGQHNVQPISSGGQFLGDTGAPSLSADSILEALTPSNISSAGAVVASFKPAAGLIIALVKLGAALVGTGAAVNPTFRQAPGAGSLLKAEVTASASGTEPTTAQAGWVKVVSQNLGGGWVAIWVKPNSAGGDVAPQFTGGGDGLSPMMAQLSEWSGVVTASPTDQTGNANWSGGALQVAAAATDAAFGNLVAFCARYSLSSGPAPTSTDTANNNAAAVNAGSLYDASVGSRYSSFAYAIVPAAKAALPFGVADWDYDATGRAAPAAGSQASVVLAATAGKTYHCATLTGSCAQSAATATERDWELLDGAGFLFSRVLGVDATAGHTDGFALSGLAYKGTAGNSMTFRANSADTGVYQRVSIGAYLR